MVYTLEAHSFPVKGMDATSEVVLANSMLISVPNNRIKYDQKTKLINLSCCPLTWLKILSEEVSLLFLNKEILSSTTANRFSKYQEL